MTTSDHKYTRAQEYERNRRETLFFRLIGVTVVAGFDGETSNTNGTAQMIEIENSNDQLFTETLKTVSWVRVTVDYQ